MKNGTYQHYEKAMAHGKEISGKLLKIALGSLPNFHEHAQGSTVVDG
jgi:hypothetical protein